MAVICLLGVVMPAAEASLLLMMLGDWLLVRWRHQS